MGNYLEMKTSVTISQTTCFFFSDLYFEVLRSYQRYYEIPLHQPLHIMSPIVHSTNRRNGCLGCTISASKGILLFSSFKGAEFSRI